MSELAEATKASRTSARLANFAKINGAKSYLEIGVSKGHTFLNVNFPLKHAVDPKFQLDVAANSSDSVRFFETTSDDFFINKADPNQKYDLMFLDGLHTFEQTFRDFCCSQAHAHDRTIWLIDDVHPNDIFSAHPNQRTTYRHRRRHGLAGKAWHGDVYKLVFAVNDFFPNLSFRTIVGGGNPQTVIIRRQRTDFAPIYDNLEQISRMTFYDFVAHRDRMNLVSDEAALDWLKG